MSIKTVRVVARDSFTMDVHTYAITRNTLESIYHSAPVGSQYIENRRDSFISFRVNSLSDVLPAGVLFASARLCFYVSSLIESAARTATLECASHYIKIEDSSIYDLVGKRWQITESDKLYTLGWHYCPLKESDLLKVLVNGISLCFFFQGAWIDPNTANIESARTANAPYIEILYDDLSDVPPIVSSPTPTGDIIDGDTAQTFSWYYAQDANTPQSHYDIQVNTNGTWTTLVNKAASTAHRHVFAANALPTGDFQWRVRAYTLGGTVCGEWSNAASVYVRQTPAAPTIKTQSINPRAYFEWTSTDQKGYRVRLSDGYDSGTRYGTETNFKLPYFLPDGEVTAFLSVGNSAGKWSKEGAKTYTVANLPRTPILAHAACRNNGVHINFSSDGVYKAFYLLRDDIPIASVSKSDTPFFDAMSLGRHVYKVRGDLGTAHYTDSAEMIVVVRMKDGAMSAVEQIDWIPMRLCANNEPTHEAGAAADIAFVFYQGRKKPVAYSMEFETETHTLGYTFCNRAEYAKLRALLGKTVVYKDGRGELLVGTMTDLSPTYGRNVDFTVSVTETDYVQEIGYE